VKPEWIERARMVDRLKKSGHAISLDVVCDSDGNIEKVRIHHYASCRRCAEMREEVRRARAMGALYEAAVA
jgi:hypothetical protein